MQTMTDETVTIEEFARLLQRSSEARRALVTADFDPNADHASLSLIAESAKWERIGFERGLQFALGEQEAKRLHDAAVAMLRSR